MTPQRSRSLYLGLVIAMLHASRYLPRAARRAEAIALGRAAYLLSRSKRETTARRLDAAFGAELSRAAKDAIAKASFNQFWRETFWMLPSPSEQRALETAPLRGEEHLRAALARGKGVVLLETNALGSRMLSRIALHARGYPIHQVHGHQHLGGFEVDPHDYAIRRWRGFFDACEGKFVADIIYLPDSDTLAFTRSLIKKLGQNAIVSLAGDGGQSQRLLGLPSLG